ncbi:MAG: thiamine phosphate synthase [Acidobacteria bacterium]|nr:thiamine phosphate synthase [Acidobacteriota bacterium]
MISMPRLYAIVDAEIASRSEWTPPDLALAYLEGGARLIQIRAPGVNSNTLLRWCGDIAEAVADTGAKLVVNNQCDVAIVTGAAGVHLGQDDLPVDAARQLLGQEAMIGLSTHNNEQIEAAIAQNVNYIAIGPIYDTDTKITGYQAVGLDAVRRAAVKAKGCPVVAIGGITLARVPDLIEAGATSVAVISDLLTGGDPKSRVRDYIAELDNCFPAEEG